MDKRSSLIAKALKNKFFGKHEDDNMANVDGCNYYSKSSEMYFRDGKRRIDFVIAYRIGTDCDINKTKRFAFLQSLTDHMIEIEVEDCKGNILAASGPQQPGIGETNLGPMKSFSNEIDENETLQNDSGNNIFANNDLAFVKLHASWHCMIRIAEILRFKKPLKQLLGITRANVEKLKLGRTVDMFRCFKANKKDVEPVPTPYTAAFSRTRLFLFEIPNDYNTFFTPTERSVVIDYILQRIGLVPDNKQADNEVIPPPSNQDIDIEVQTGAVVDDLNLIENEKMVLTIDQLIHDSVFQAAFPLHDPSVEELKVVASNQANDDRFEQNQPGQNKIENNMRIMLTNQWASFRKIYQHQPLDYVRLYFGESIALYFAWLGLYTSWLVPVSIFGLLVFAFSAVGIKDDIPIADVCDRGNQLIMCPPCNVKGCKFWRLNSSCLAMKLTHLVDNPGTVLFAVFMALWATLFMEQWKRRQNVLAIRWNVQNYEPVDEPPRPEFLALLKKKNIKVKINPITGCKEPNISFWTRKVPVFTVTYMTVMFGVLLTLAFLVGVIFYRLVINVLLMKDKNAFINSTAGLITTITSSFINLVCIFFLKMIYDRVAVVMTNIENYRTQSAYDQSLTLKLYLLQFVNMYSSIFYIAFVQGPSAALPGDTTIPVQSKGCDSGNCLFQLFIQLAIIMVGKQFLNLVTENTLPVLKRYGRIMFESRRTKKLREQKLKRLGINADASEPELSGLRSSSNIPIGWNIESNKEESKQTLPKSMFLCCTNYILNDSGSRPLFDEYLEMLIQYGFITLFVPAFPLAPIFALMNNVFEIRTDAKKFVCNIRRPIAKREKSIGIWFSILNTVSSLAIRTNACLIAFTTGFIDRLVYTVYYSQDNSLKGYINFSLSYMNSSRFKESDASILNGSVACRYPAFRASYTETNAYQYTSIFWHILAMKFLFVFVFENVAIVLTSVIGSLIPDMPDRLRIISRHEARVVNDLIIQGEVKSTESLSNNQFQPPLEPPKIGFHDFQNST